VSITAGHPVRVIQARRAVSASAVSTSAASDTSCLLLLRSLQLTAGVGPTNRGCGLVAGPPGRIRWLIGPICCVTGSKRALELGGGRDGRLRTRRTPDLVHPAQRAPDGSGRRAPSGVGDTRRAPDGSGRRGHASGAVGRRRAPDGSGRRPVPGAAGTGVGRRGSGRRAPSRVGRRRAPDGSGRRGHASGAVGRRHASGAGVGRCRRYIVSTPKRATTDRCEPPARKASMVASRCCAPSRSARLFRDRGPSRSVLAYAIQLECSGTGRPSRDRPGQSRDRPGLSRGP
jgi:hypothetical protein